MTRLVIDASVAAKWVLPEVHSDAARCLPTRTTMLAPDLLWAELGNVLWARQKRGELTVVDARDTLAKLRSFRIRVYPLSPLLPAALDLAMAIDHAVYDCLYLALAEVEDSVVVTADRRFHRRVRDSVLADRILWVEDV